MDLYPTRITLCFHRHTSMFNRRKLYSRKPTTVFSIHMALEASLSWISQSFARVNGEWWAVGPCVHGAKLFAYQILERRKRFPPPAWHCNSDKCCVGYIYLYIYIASIYQKPIPFSTEVESWTRLFWFFSQQPASVSLSMAPVSHTLILDSDLLCWFVATVLSALIIIYVGRQVGGLVRARRAHRAPSMLPVHRYTSDSESTDSIDVLSVPQAAAEAHRVCLLFFISRYSPPIYRLLARRLPSPWERMKLCNLSHIQQGLSMAGLLLFLSSFQLHLTQRLSNPSTRASPRLRPLGGLANKTSLRFQPRPSKYIPPVTMALPGIDNRSKVVWYVTV